MEKNILIQNRREYQLHAIHFSASEVINYFTPLVILIHGYCGDKINAGFNAEGFETGRYRKLADALLENGYDVLTFDLSGHGENVREPLRITHFIADVEDVFAWAQSEGYSRIGTIAYSIGGFASVHATIPKRIVSVLWSPAFYPTRSKSKIKLFFYKIAATFVKSPKKDGANFEDVWVDGVFLQESIRGTSDAVLKNCHVPTYILNGSKDTLVRWEWSQEAYGKMPHDAHHQFKIVEGAEHHYDTVLLQQFIDESLRWIKKYL